MTDETPNTNTAALPPEVQASFTRDRERVRALTADALVPAEVSALLGVAEADLEARPLFAFDVDGSRRYPRWQFDASQPGGVIGGLSRLLDAFALSRLDPIDQAFWLTTTQPFLNWERPIDWLRRGDSEAVVQSARAAGWR